MKKDIIIGEIRNYEIAPGIDTDGFTIYLKKPIKTGLIAEWVGRRVKITLEEI